MWLQPLGRSSIVQSSLKSFWPGTKFTPAKLEGGAGHNGHCAACAESAHELQLHIFTWVSFIAAA